MESSPLTGQNGSGPSPRIVARNTVSDKQALAVQGGLLLLAGSVYYAIFTHDWILFSYHPVFNVAAIVLFVEAILLVQPSPQSVALKELSGQVHGYVQLGASTFFAVGAGSILYNKSLQGKGHFTSWHGTFGIVTYLLLLGNGLLGVVQFWLPRQLLGSQTAGKRFYRFHRLWGYAIIASIALTVLLALDADYNVNVLHISYLTILPAFALIVVGVLSRLQPQKIKVW